MKSIGRLFLPSGETSKKGNSVPCTGCACALNVLLAFSSHPVKFVKKLDQRPFFDPRYVGAGDSQFPCDFPLVFFLASVQSEAVSDHFLFPRIEDVQVIVYSFL